MRHYLPAFLAAFVLIASVAVVRWCVVPRLKQAFFTLWDRDDLPSSFWFVLVGLLFLLSAGTAIGSGDVRWIAGGLLACSALTVLASRLRR